MNSIEALALQFFCSRFIHYFMEKYNEYNITPGFNSSVVDSLDLGVYALYMHMECELQFFCSRFKGHIEIIRFTDWQCFNSSVVDSRTA